MLRRARLFLAVTTPVASNALCLQRSALLADRSALIRHRQTIIDHRRQVWEKQQQQNGGGATAEDADGSLVRQLTNELSRTDAMIEDFGRSLRHVAAAPEDGQLLPQPTSPTLLRTDDQSSAIPPTRDPPKAASYLVPRTVAGTSVPMRMPTAVVALANTTSVGERSLIVADTGSNRLVAWDHKATSCQLLSDQMALPLAMAVTTDQKHLVVAAKTATGGEVMVVETAAPTGGGSPRRLIEDALVPVPHGWHKPCAVLALPDGNVLVADNGSLDSCDRPQGRLVVVSPKTKAVVRVLPPSPAVHCPTGLALYPTTTSDEGSSLKVLVCNGSSGGNRDALVVIDCADGALLRASDSASDSNGMVGPPDGRFKSLTSAYSVATHNQVAYVADSSAGELVTVSLQTGMVLLRQPMPGIRRVSVLPGEPPALAVSAGNEVQIITL